MSQRRIAEMIPVCGACLMKEDESFLTCSALEKNVPEVLQDELDYNI